jgi:plastocyanin
MKRALVAVVAAAVVAPAGAAAPPARVQVGASEFAFTLSRSTIKSGRAFVELANYGEDPHNLRMQRIGGKRVYAIGTVGPEEQKTLSAVLLPGRFRLWCAIADHRARGMSATLLVKK